MALPFKLGRRFAAKRGNLISWKLLCFPPKKGLPFGVVALPRGEKKKPPYVPLDLPRFSRTPKLSFSGGRFHEKSTRFRPTLPTYQSLLSVAFCSPAQSLTFSGLVENPLVGKKLFSPSAKCAQVLGDQPAPGPEPRSPASRTRSGRSGDCITWGMTTVPVWRTSRPKNIPRPPHSSSLSTWHVSG